MTDHNFDGKINYVVELCTHYTLFSFLIFLISTILTTSVYYVITTYYSLIYLIYFYHKYQELFFVEMKYLILCKWLVRVELDEAFNLVPILTHWIS